MIASPTRLAVRAAWPKWKLAAALKGVDIALRVPLLRDVLVDKLVRSLNTSYDVNDDDADRLAHVRWLGPHLEAFLRRLIDERPAGARAILRFLATWVRDMHRRTGRQRQGLAAPATVVIEPTDRPAC